jgi:hypothetical protein
MRQLNYFGAFAAIVLLCLAISANAQWFGQNQYNNNANHQSVLQESIQGKLQSYYKRKDLHLVSITI